MSQADPKNKYWLQEFWDKCYRISKDEAKNGIIEKCQKNAKIDDSGAMIIDCSHLNNNEVKQIIEFWKNGNSYFEKFDMCIKDINLDGRIIKFSIRLPDGFRY